ncbi:MAG: HNH endonuclease [Candidatus Melainabacteria bacterium]|nr:HNH endonuclease [Candidatus Melainabacteria bacterium]MBI3307837.1 HNH endonuclease [Candidatus Melainabacteria bacterium]
MISTKNKVLVLNASYEPLNICGWKRAVVLLFKGKAEQIEHNGKIVYADFPLPTVIRLRRYIKIPYKEIPLTRKNLMYRDHYSCQYCGLKSHALTIDHVVPRSKSGADTWDNVVACCQLCNVKKGNRTPKTAGLQLLKHPKAPIGHLYFEIKRLASLNFPDWQKYIIGMTA